MTISGKYQAGEFVNVDGKILVSLETFWMKADWESNIDAGWYTAVAEPTEAERQGAAYQQLDQQMTTARNQETREAKERQEHYEQARAAATHTPEEVELAKETGMDLDLWDDLFAGTSDN